MTLLSILTRTFNGRPVGMQRLQESLRRQTSQDFEHVLMVDSERRGIEWTHANLWRMLPDLRGDYVMLLDDDDYLVDAEFVKDLAEIVSDRPEVVIVKMDMSNGWHLPSDLEWNQRPKLARIAISSHISRRDVFAEHVRDFKPYYDGGDFEYIDHVWQCGHQFKWWNRIVAKVGRVSHGSQEDGHPVAVA